MFFQIACKDSENHGKNKKFIHNVTKKLGCRVVDVKILPSGKKSPNIGSKILHSSQNDKKLESFHVLTRVKFLKDPSGNLIFYQVKLP